MKEKSKTNARGIKLQVDVDTTDALAKIAELNAALYDVSVELAQIIDKVSNINISVGVSNSGKA